MSVPPSIHPWPALERAAWSSLNGNWDFRADPDDRGVGEGWSGGWTQDGEKILVPFAWSTLRSGIFRPWLPIGWYRRRIRAADLPPAPPGSGADRSVVVFGAVHHQATVWANGALLVEHVGGSRRFECDITEALGAGFVELVVRVVAPTDKRSLPHGKQRSIPTDDFDGCSFTPTSGIWQEVWLERRPGAQITSLQVRPGKDLTSFLVRIRCTAGHPADSVVVSCDDGAEVTLPVVDGTAELDLPLTDPRLWSPLDPHLYRITAELRDDGAVDRVSTRTGLRRFEFAAGELRLNGAPIHLRGVLDQGYWPETGLTPESPETLRRDLELARRAGFTFIRKHLKFEDPRQIAMADELGLLMWVEPPSYSVYSPEAAALFRGQIPEMVERYGNSPSVIVYGLYNEEWGFRWRVAEEPVLADELRTVYAQTRELDPSRAVIDNSGWSHVVTDLMDWHAYTGDLQRWRELSGAIARGELAGLDVGTTVDNTMYRPLQVGGEPDPSIPVINSEYGVGLTSLERAWHLKWQTLILRLSDTNHGYIYCEIADIEHETAGVYAEYRTPKDLGSLVPSDVHADTVVIPLLDPVEPGIDILWPPGRARPLTVRVSHHGPELLQANVSARWHSTDQDAVASAEVRVEPYRCGSPVDLTIPAPAGAGQGSAATLFLTVLDHAGQRIARTPLDVFFSAPETAADRHVPEDPAS